MKKALKVWLIVAASFFLAGIIASVIGLSLVDFQFWNLSDGGDYTEKIYTAEMTAGEISEIEVGAVDTPVVLRRTNGDKVVVSYYENNTKHYQIVEGEDKKLWIWQKDERKWYDYICNWDFNNSQITIEVPKTFTGNLDINTSNGSIDLIDLGTVNEVTCETSNGRLNITNLNAKKFVNAYTSNGQINAENITAKGGASFRTKNAAIHLASVTTEDELRCNTSNSRIEAENVKGDTCTIFTSNGNLWIRNAEIAKEMSLSSSNGKIEVENIKGNSIDLQTSNAEIKGTISGKLEDYTIESHTSNANNNLPELYTGGSKRLYVKTSNASVNVKFIKN